MEFEEIMERLLGNIAPVGETNEDNKRFENIENYEIALNYIIEELLNAYDYIGSFKYSERRIAIGSKEILICLKEKLEDTLE